VDTAGSCDSDARRIGDFWRDVNGLTVRVMPLGGQEFDALQMVRMRNFGARPLHIATGVEHSRQSAGGRDVIAQQAASVDTGFAPTSRLHQLGFAVVRFPPHNRRSLILQ
jgi:hypothetical protein